MQNILWQSVDGIGLEYLQLSNQQNGILADSILICVIEGKPARISYQIRCDNSWQFQKLNLTVDTGIKQTLSLEITPEGQWLNESDKILEELEGCLEPDILLTGFTNTLPIRRLNLIEGQSAEITVSYISIPQLTVIPIKQRYICLGKTPNGIVFHYKNLNSGFETDITVDENFLVVDYPQLFRRII